MCHTARICPSCPDRLQQSCKSWHIDPQSLARSTQMPWQLLGPGAAAAGVTNGPAGFNSACRDAVVEGFCVLGSQQVCVEWYLQVSLTTTCFCYHPCCANALRHGRVVVITAASACCRVLSPYNSHPQQVLPSSCPYTASYMNAAFLICFWISPS